LYQVTPLYPFARAPFADDLVCGPERDAQGPTRECQRSPRAYRALSVALCTARARALYSSHASAWCSDLLDDTCLGKRNSVKNARQVQGAGRRWGVLRFPRSVSNGATRVTMRQLGVVTCMAPALAKCNGVRSARQVQQAVDRRWGVNSGSRDPRQHGARAARE